jgi:hypothetical protein
MKILMKVALAALACLLLTEVVPVPYCGVASTQAQVVPALAVTEEELVLDREEDRLTLYWSGRVAYVKPSEEPLSVVTSVSLAPSGVWSSAAGRRAHHAASQKRGLNVLSEKTSVATTGAVEKIGPGPWYRQIALLFDKDQVVKLKVALNRTGSMATDAPPLAEMNFRLSPLGYGLLAAARAGDVSAVRELLDKGADADSADLGGWTALMAAASEGRRDVVDLLLDRGAKVNTRGKGLPFQLSANGSKEPSGTTALMTAAYAGNSEIVRVLLAKNASVNSRREDQWTALMCATYADNANALSSLLGAGAEINATNDAGYSALALAIINGNKAAARLLEARGAILRVPWNPMAE